MRNAAPFLKGRSHSHSLPLRPPVPAIQHNIGTFCLNSQDKRGPSPPPVMWIVVAFKDMIILLSHYAVALVKWIRQVCTDVSILLLFRDLERVITFLVNVL